MHELPEDATSVVSTQMEKLLSTVLHSQEIDNYMALTGMWPIAYGNPVSGPNEEECNKADIVKLLHLHGFAVKCALTIPTPVVRLEAIMRMIQSAAYGSAQQELLDTPCFLDGEQARRL
ncbi:unnamed protein product [Peronospora farinosa]|uniref:Uncharacterized protein n=1 Tax=Peronospora farinosa TaxID=134698 RepID=A0ABN8C4Y7_9STRA|nr:unnamed protein product [Peronospora farinosa]